jgi:hypothetical protein
MGTATAMAMAVAPVDTITAVATARIVDCISRIEKNGLAVILILRRSPLN